MKRVRPDIGEQLVGSYLNGITTVKRFKRFWGTTTIDGTEVLTPRIYYYPFSHADSNEKILRHLKAYEDVKSANIQGIENAWFYLNKNNGSDLDYGSGQLNSFISDNLNLMWWNPADGTMPTGLTLTTTINIKTRDDVSILNPNSSESTLKTQIENNYDTLWSNAEITQEGIGVINKGSIHDSVLNIDTPDEDDLSPNDAWLSCIARYALRSDGTPCTIKSVKRGIEINHNPLLGGYRYFYTYVVELEIPYTSFTSASSIVESIATDVLNAPKSNTVTIGTKKSLDFSNARITRGRIASMDSSDLEDEIDVINRPYTLWEDETDISTIGTDIWITSSTGGVWARNRYYLKAAVFDNPKNFGLTYKQLYEYMYSLIDNDYQKKKVKWYKKLVAAIIFIVVFYFTWQDGGYTASALASAIVAGSIAISLMSMAFSALGMEDWATAFAQFNEMIEPLVMVARIIMIYNFFTSMWESASTEVATTSAKEAVGEQAFDTATDEIKQELVKEALREVTVEQVITHIIQNASGGFVDNIIKGATDLVSGNITNQSLDFLNTLVKVSMMPQQNKLKDIQDRNRDLLAEADELEKAQEARESDPLKGFARIYSKPATADWSVYAAQFDLPYERGGGPLAMGNIQRTTKKALRKGDYTLPVFDNIIGV